MIQRSLVIFKPDVVKRGVVGEIFSRFERVGLKMVAAKFMLPSKELAEKHYPDSREWRVKAGTHTVDDCKKYGISLMESVGTEDPYEIGGLVKKWNVDYLTSGPVLVAVFEGANAVERIRSLVGPTVPVVAPAGTIRGDYSLDSAVDANKANRSIYNLLHASGTPEEAVTEIEMWFKPEEILPYQTTLESIYTY